MQGVHIHVCKYLMGRTKEDEARTSSVVLNEWTRGNEQNLKYRKFHLKLILKKTEQIPS